MRRIFLLLSVFLLCSTNAEATIYEFSGTNPTGQRTRTILPVEEIFASYNDVTTELIFRVTFAPGEQPNAFTLVLNYGPEPRDQDDVALFFFDYTRGTPTLTANVYDGTNGVRSYLTQPSLITANDKPNGTHNIFVT